MSQPRTLSLFLSPLPLVAWICLPAVASGQLQDGDMEAPTVAAWTPYGVPAAMDKGPDAHQGALSLHIQSDRGHGAQQMGLSRERGARFRLVVYHRVLSGEAEVRVGWGSSNRDLAGLRARLAPSQAWERYERIFTTPGTPGDLRVVLVVRGEALFDDVTLEALPGAPGEDLVVDGAMESTEVEGWEPYGTDVSFEKSEAERFSGVRSLHVVSTRHGVQQAGLSRNAGGTFRLDMRYRVESGSMIVRLGWGTSNRDMERTVVVYPSGGWAELERVVTAPGSPGDLRLVLVARGEVFVDDVTLVEVPEADLEQVLDPGMEPDPPRWSTYGWPDVAERVSDRAHGGDASMHVVSTGHGIQQRLGEPLSDVYQVSLWYWLGSGTLTVRLGCDTSNRDCEGGRDVVREPGAWTYHERLVQVAPGTRDLRIVLLADGEAWVDDVSVKPVVSYYCDQDLDGVVGSAPAGSCPGFVCAPGGCVSSPGADCDDQDPDVSPLATELCDNQRDDDCDREVDEGCELVCDQGFEDCDGDPSNGCEADLLHDPDNCNQCGHLCPDPYPMCGAGEPACVPREVRPDGVYYEMFPECDSNDDGIIGRSDQESGVPAGCDLASVNYCLEASDACGQGQEEGDYGCAAWRENCSRAEWMGLCTTGGSGGWAEPLDNQNVVIAGASQAGLGRLEDVPNVDYINWWDLSDWISGVHDQVLTHPDAVSTVGFWFCANSFRRDHVRSHGGPADGVLTPGEEESWGVYSTGITNAIFELLDNGFDVVLGTTNTTTLAPGYPEPISQGTQDNLYAWNDYIRCLAFELMEEYPGRVALFDIAALTSTEVNGTLRPEYADRDQYHLTGRAYQEVLRPELEKVLDSIGIFVDYPYVDPWRTGWWNRGPRFW